MSFTVTLSDAEILVCRTLGAMRSIVARAANVKDAKIGDQSGADGDVDGMIGEYAFCKLFNVFPDIVPAPRSGSYDAIMVSKKRKVRVDVKTTRYKNGRLLATKKGNSDVDVYVLATLIGNEVTFVGWAKRDVLCVDANLTDLGHGKGYGMDQKSLIELRVPEELMCLQS